MGRKSHREEVELFRRLEVAGSHCCPWGWRNQSQEIPEPRGMVAAGTEGGHCCYSEKSLMCCWKQQEGHWAQQPPATAGTRTTLDTCRCWPPRHPPRATPPTPRAAGTECSRRGSKGRLNQTCNDQYPPPLLLPLSLPS